MAVPSSTAHQGEIYSQSVWKESLRCSMLMLMDVWHLADIMLLTVTEITLFLSIVQIRREEEICH